MSCWGWELEGWFGRLGVGAIERETVIHSGSDTCRLGHGVHGGGEEFGQGFCSK